MSERFMAVALKIIALTGVLSLLYPGVLITRFYFFPDSTGIVYLLSSLAALMGGFVIASVIVREKSDFYSRLITKPAIEFIFGYRTDILFLSGTIASITVLFPAAVTAMIFRNAGIIRMLFEVTVMVLFYIMGLRGCFIEYDNIMSDVMARIGIFVTVASLIANYYIGISSFIYNLPYFSILALMIVANQVNIERVFIRMNRQLSGMSKGIRTYNLLFILSLFCILALLLNFKRFVVSLLYAVKAGLQSALLMLSRFLSTFFTLRKTETHENGMKGAAPFLADDNGYNPYTNFIFRVIVCFVVLYTLYKLVPAIWRMVRKVMGLKVLSIIQNTIRKLTAKIVAFFRKLFKGAAGKGDFADEYMDKIEFLTEIPAEEEKNAGRRHHRRSVRGLKKLTDPIQRVRFMYGMILDGMIQRRVNIEKSDTTGEIQKKSLYAVSSDEPLRDITVTYDKARYGDTAPTTEELELFEEHFLKLDENLHK